MSGSDHSICYLLSSTSTSDRPRCVGGPEKDASKEHRPIGAMSMYHVCSSGAGGEGGNKQATEALLNLYTAIKNVQVMTFVCSLLTAMGKHIEFVIQPTPLGGMNAGIHWKLELDRAFMPFGKGLSFYMVQVCIEKAFIRNADTFIEPIVHGMEPMLLKWAAFLGPIVGRVSPIIKHRRTRAFIYCLLTVVTMSTLLTILKGALL